MEGETAESQVARSGMDEAQMGWKKRDGVARKQVVVSVEVAGFNPVHYVCISDRVSACLCKG